MIDIGALRGHMLYLDEDIGISYEDVNGAAMCHCQVVTAKKSILRRCRYMIHSLQMQHQRDAYGICEKDDHKHKKFLTFMGFEFFRNKWILDDDGNDSIVEVWRRDYAKHRHRTERCY